LGNGAAGPTQLHNVAAGTSGSDAVNLDQLNNGLKESNSYTDQRTNQLQNSIDSAARNAYSGIAAATALGMIPDVDMGKTLAVGIGYGQYKGYSASAIGMNARITENIKVKSGVGISSSGTTFGFGGSYQW
jgi:autotransporter adhesin